MVVDYSKAKIYKIYNNRDDDIYIGSTCCSLSMRMAKHRAERNNEKVKHRRLYNKMNEIGVENFYIVLIVEMPECQSKEQLHKKEREKIEEYKPALNYAIPTRTFQDWVEDNREYVREFDRNYRRKNREHRNETQKKWRENNPQKIQKYKKADYEKNREKILEQKKEHYKKKRNEYKQEENKKEVSILNIILYIILIMFHKIDYKHQPKPIALTKGQSTYKKLEKTMNSPPSDYNSIKKLIENNENNIEKISNNIQSKSVKLIPHKKK